MRLSQQECRTRLTAARVARLASVDAQGQPHLVPVTFAVDGATLFFAVDHKPKPSTDLRRLRNIAANPKVSLLVDHYEEDWRRLWWVRADGLARVLAPQEGKQGAVALLVAKYEQYQALRPTGDVIRVELSTWRGWSAAG